MTENLKPTNEKPEQLRLEGMDSVAVQAAIRASKTPEARADEDSLSLLCVFGKSTLHTAVQHPLEGFTQLVNKITPLDLPMPHLMDAPRQEQFASKRWMASTIGQGAGFIVPFAITERATSGVANLYKAARGVRAAETVAMTPMSARFLPPTGALVKATVDGGLSGFVFTPSMPGNGGFWEQRGLSALSSATMFGAQYAGAHALGHGLQRLGAPMTNDLVAATSKQIVSRLGVNATSGVVGGVLGAEVTSLASGHGFADSQTLKEAALAAAVTGFSLDAYHITKAKIFESGGKPGETGKAPQEPAPATHGPIEHKFATDQALALDGGPLLGLDSTAVVPRSAAENTKEPVPVLLGPTGRALTSTGERPVLGTPENPVIDTSRRPSSGTELMIVPQPQPIDVLLAVPKHRAVETFVQPGDVGDGAVKYKAADGQKFWQLPDGTVYFESAANSTADGAQPGRRTFWNPYGMGSDTVYVDRLNPNKESYQIATRDEAMGMFKDPDGKILHPEIANDYSDASGPPYGRDVPQSTWDALTIPTRRLEPDFIARLRVLPAKNGQPYESYTLPVRVLKENAPPVEKGLPYDIFFYDHMKPEIWSARKYRVLSEPQVQEFALATRELSEGKITDAAYEAKLDRLRDEALSVVVEESYAKKLDALRDVRETATMDISKNHDQREQIMLARRQLYLSTYGNRFLPEHMGQFADVVPNRDRIPELILMEHGRPEDAHDIAHGGNGTIADTVLSTGLVRFFGDHAGVWQHVRRTFTHEWFHTTENPNADLVTALSHVSKMDTFAGRTYANKNSSESWAVNGAEMFLDPNPELFLTLAHRSPIKALILSEAVSRELKAATDGQRSTDADILSQRVNYAQQENLPAARKQFNDLLGSRETMDAARTLALVDGLAASKEGYKLVEKLVDAQRVAELVDTAVTDSTASGAKHFDFSLEARRLLRMELLRTVDFEAFDAISARHAEIKSQLKDGIKARIASGDRVLMNEAYELGNALVLEPNTQRLFQELFDRKQLERTVYAETTQAGREQALQLLSTGYERPDNHDFFMGLILVDGPLRDEAANWLINDSSATIQSKTHQILQGELAAGSLNAIGPKTLANLKELADSKLAYLENRALEPFLAIRTFRRVELLEHHSRAVPEAHDAAMTARLERAERVKKLIAQQATEVLTGKDPRKAENLLAATAELMKTDEGKELARSILPQDALLGAVHANQTYSARALDQLRWLYDRAKYTDLYNQLARSDSGLQNEALRQIAWEFDTQHLENALPIIEALNQQGKLEGNKMLTVLNNLFEVSKKYASRASSPQLSVRIRAAREVLNNAKRLDPKIADATRQHLADLEPLLSEPK